MPAPQPMTFSGPAQGLAIACGFVALALAGCGKPLQGEVPPQDEEGRYVIAMTSDLTFDPAVAQVPAGAVVVWRNTSEATVHDVAGYKGDPIEEDREEFSSFDQPPDGLGRPIAPGENFTRTFAEKGAWTIWCHTHHEQDMKGVVRVG
jgi:plastocyanin